MNSETVDSLIVFLKEIDWAVWGPPLAVMVVAFTAGIIFIFWLKEAPHQSNLNEELSAQKAQLLEQIRELDADKDKFAADEYQVLREKLIEGAARVLKQMEGPSLAKKPVIQSSISSAFILNFVVLISLFGAILYGVTQFAKPRGENQIMTGGESTAIDLLLAERQARIDAATAVNKEDPNDLGALNTLSYDALMRQDLQTAMGYIDTARGLYPEDPDVLLHLAILQIQVGMEQRAELGISQALSIRPDFSRGYLWRCFLRMRSGNIEGANIDLLEAEGKLDDWPEDMAFFNAMYAELNKPPPILLGKVNTAGNAVPPSGGILFVIARRSEVGGGPPVAVSRIPSPTFPTSFALGKGDMVMGGQWPEEVWLEVRLDGDGNAMTKADTDWVSGLMGPFKGEQQELEITIDGIAEIAPEPPSEEENAASRITGTIRLESEMSESGVLFVIVRSSEVSKGPPFAVKRISEPSFPLEFSMNDSDIMMGGDWPEEVWLEARLDLDGNPMTKGEGDPTSARQGPILKGQDIQVTLGDK